MSRTGKRFVALLIWTGIGILIGMQLGGEKASPPAGGVQTVQQVQQEPAAGQSEAGTAAEGIGWGGVRKSPPASGPNEETEIRPEFEPLPRDILLPERSSPPADVLADKTAGLLQELSDQSIRWVVSMFGSIVE